MDKNRQQLIILGVVVAIFIVSTVITVYKPRAKRAAKARSLARAAALAAAMPKSAPQKERIISSFKSWGRDPFAIGVSSTEEESGPVLLSGIFCDPQKSYCIIGGKVAKVGDEVSGYRILEINKDTVTVKVGDEIRVLRIGR